MPALPRLPGRPLTPDEVNGLPDAVGTVDLAIPWFGRVTDDGFVVTGMLVAVNRDAFSTGFDPARSAWIDLAQFPAVPDGETLGTAIRAVRVWLETRYPDELVIPIRSGRAEEA